MKKIIFPALILLSGLSAIAQINDPKGFTPGYNFQVKEKFPLKPRSTENNVPVKTDPDIPSTFDPTWAARFQTVLDSVVPASGVKGVSAAVLAPGQGLWTGVSGISSAGVPITKEMRLGFASNTKLFIAVTLAKLQEQGVLSLDDHLYQWLPAFSHVDSTTTIRQLLSHQSGIFDFWNDNQTWFWNIIYADTAHFWTPQEILATIGNPHFAPGNGYRYSNTNYILAGMVIEAATGTSWVQKMHDFIFNPLTMDSTFVGALEPRNGPVAHEWALNYGEVVNSPMTSAYSAIEAAGAIESTPQEMAEWYSSLFNGAVISDASLQEVLNFEPTSQYGLGIAEYLANDSHFSYVHGGALIGCLSQLVFDVQTGSVMSIITNSRDINFGTIMAPMMNVWMNEYPRKQHDAGITNVVSPWEISCNATIAPSVVLTNFGSTPLSGVDIHYFIDNGAASFFHWTGSLSTDDTAMVILPQVTVVDGYHTFTCFTSLPNGAQDGFTNNDTTKSNFIVNTSGSTISGLNESFDGGVFPPAGWAESSSSIYNWARTILARFSGTGSAVISNYNDYHVGAKYDLDLPLIHIEGGTHPLLGFKYAYAMYPSNRKDTLQVLISADCGATWQKIYNKGGYVLHTTTNHSEPFYPQTAAEWKQESISLAAFTGDVLIRFRSVCGNSNNLFLDDVTITFPTGIAAHDPSQSLTVYPNPATSVINITGLRPNSEIRITDLTGKVLMTETASGTHASIDIQMLPQGVYILRNINGVRKIVKL